MKKIIYKKSKKYFAFTKLCLSLLCNQNENIMITLFYNFRQNNSGGYFVKNDELGIGEEVIIESSNAKSAFEKLELIGSNVSGFWSYCACCGERWSSWIDDEDGKDRAEIYGVPVEEVKKDYYRNNTFVHYIDGTFKKFVHE